MALARALVIEPSILLLDEPLSNLDAQLRKRMRWELRDIQRRLGITTVFVTHDQDEAFEMSDRVALMNAGRVEQIGSPEDIYDRPRTRFAAEFIGEASLLQGNVAESSGKELVIAIGDMRIPAVGVTEGMKKGSAAILMARPERIDIDSAGASGTETMRVTGRVFHGDRLLFELAAGENRTVHCSVPSVESYRRINVGDAVGVRFRECRALPVE